MPIIREEWHVRRASPIASEAVDISTYDFGLRYTTDAKVEKCGSAEIPQFFAAETALADEPISVVYVQRGLRAGLKMTGSGSKGAKIACDANGNFAASGTAETAVLAAGDFAIALETFIDGDTVEVDVVRGV